MQTDPLQDPAVKPLGEACGRFEESTERTSEWSGGTIIKTHKDGSFDIDFEDGSREKRVPSNCVERIPTGNSPKVATWDKPAVAPLGVNDVIRGKQKVCVCGFTRKQHAPDLDPFAVPRWFYTPEDGGEAVGPHNLRELKDLWKARTINNDSRLWREGLNEWTRIDELLSLIHI